MLNQDKSYTQDLLKTKLHKPILREKLVKRSRLTDLLQIGSQSKLTIVVAPAGYGKTTLLGEWLVHTDLETRPVAWLSLDEQDNDPYLFWSYFVAALNKIIPDLSVDLHFYLNQPRDSKTYQALNPLINKVIAFPKHFSLVLDDYHYIHSQSIHEAITYLIEYMPENMSLIISSRTEPPIKLFRWRALGQIVEITTNKLMFNPNEADTFLSQVMNLSIPINELNRLLELTEGWITGLQLAAISMRQLKDPLHFISEFSGSHRHIFNYLTGEVLIRQSPEIISFLLNTSILKRFCVPLCDYLLGRKDSEELISHLEQMNLFITPVDENRQWFRFHTLFSDILQTRLRKVFPETVKDLHIKACQWFRLNGYLEEAIPHALASENKDLVADIVEACAMNAIIEYNLFNVIHWIDQLPGSFLLHRPRLAVYHALANILMGCLDDVELKLRIAEDIYFSEGEHDPTNDSEAFIIRVIHAIRASLNCLLADYDQGIKQAIIVLNNLPEEDYYIYGFMNHILGYAYDLAGDLNASAASFLKGSEFARRLNYPKEVILSLSERARILRMQGKLRAAGKEYQHILDIAQDNEVGEDFFVLPKAGIGDIFVEWNDLSSAQKYMEEVVSYFTRVDIQTVSWIHSVILCSKLAKYKLAINDLDGANYFYLKANKSIHYTQLFNHLAAELVGVQTQLWLAQGDLTSIHEWMDEKDNDIDAQGQKLSLVEQLAFARFHYELGDFDKAWAKLAEVENYVRLEDRIEILIDLLILKAKLYAEGGNKQLAYNSLIQALNYAEPENYVRVFVNGGETIRKLLRFMVNYQAREHFATKKELPSKDYVEHLLNAFDERFKAANYIKNAQKPKIITPLLETLSERELEILRLMSDGKSLHGISEMLHISKNTVKTHIRNIYQKLGVHNRNEAIKLALELNILQ